MSTHDRRPGPTPRPGAASGSSSGAGTGAGAVHTENSRFRALPANVTFYDLIRRNKRKSVFLVGLMIVLLTVFGAAIGGLLGAMAGPADTTPGFTADRPGVADQLFPSLILGGGVALVLAAIGAVWSWYGGSNAILRMSGARPLEKRDDPQLFNVVEELAIAAGVPMPAVYLIDDDALNAFATGRDPEHGAVAITRGLREKLSRDELAGVMAHEIAHIRNYDIRLMVLVATMVGLIVFAADAFRRMMFYGMMMGGGRRGGGGGKGGGPLVLVLLLVVLILSIVAPILALLIRFAISRQREFLADASAVEITRYPPGMIGALEKLKGCRQSLEGANRATAHMFIINPLKNAKKGHSMSSVFRTHPSIDDRIARLRALMSR